MPDLRATLDYIQSKRFKKESGYETTLAEMLEGAKKAKADKVLYEMKSKDDSMKFRAKGKKTSPVNMLDYSKIRSLTKSSPTEKAVAFACPGPNEKNPVMLYAMRFKKENDYERFIRRVEFPPSSKYRDSEYIASSTERLTQSSRPMSREFGEQTSSAKLRGHRTRSRASKYTTSTSSSSSSSVSTSTERGHSLSDSSRKRGHKSASTYISTDELHPPYVKSRRNPVISARTNYETSYISTKARIYNLYPSYRPAHSVRPQSVRVRNVYQVTRDSSADDSSSASWTSASTLLSDFTELSFSSLEYLMGSSDFSSDDGIDW
ncbi:unnamed protein product [Rodentolepis nana]|uniref:DUF5734 domain-containing protein n=1 Tax=Rodentolepis nana TaxID=102285 RepID=A0A0R3TTR9_RODNA|nr:unnamed protein product [Rodentolepis nana]